MSEDFEIDGYTIEERRFALPIMRSEFPGALDELQAALNGYRIDETEVLEGGGGETTHTQRLRRQLDNLGWKKKNISTCQNVTVASVGEKQENYSLPSESHEVDHVKRFEKGTIALEIEWNNKDPFYDRDLENFRRLHHIGLVKVGIIVTRGPTLQSHLHDVFVRHYSDTNIYRDLESVPGTPKQKQRMQKLVRNDTTIGESAAQVLFKDKFGTATTHWEKLIERVDKRLLGHPCPLLMIGIDSSRIDPAA